MLNLPIMACKASGSYPAYFFRLAWKCCSFLPYTLPLFAFIFRILSILSRLPFCAYTFLACIIGHSFELTLYLSSLENSPCLPFHSQGRLIPPFCSPVIICAHTSHLIVVPYLYLCSSIRLCPLRLGLCFLLLTALSLK